MTSRMYHKWTPQATTWVTVDPEDAGTVRIVKDDGVIHQRRFSFPTTVEFHDSDVVTVDGREKLDRVLGQKGYKRFEV